MLGKFSRVLFGIMGIGSPALLHTSTENIQKVEYFGIEFKKRVNQRLIWGNFWHQKWAWIVINFFRGKTLLIWNVLSTDSKNWHIRHFSHSVLATEYGFRTKIEKCYQSWNFEIFKLHQATVDKKSKQKMFWK